MSRGFVVFAGRCRSQACTQLAQVQPGPSVSDLA